MYSMNSWACASAPAYTFSCKQKRMLINPSNMLECTASFSDLDYLATCNLTYHEAELNQVQASRQLRPRWYICVAPLIKPHRFPHQGHVDFNSDPIFVSTESALHAQPGTTWKSILCTDKRTSADPLADLLLSICLAYAMQSWVRFAVKDASDIRYSIMMLMCWTRCAHQHYQHTLLCTLWCIWWIYIHSITFNNKQICILISVI